MVKSPELKWCAENKKKMAKKKNRLFYVGQLSKTCLPLIRSKKTFDQEEKPCLKVNTQAIPLQAITSCMSYLL